MPLPGIPGMHAVPQLPFTATPINPMDSMMPNQQAAAGAAVPEALRSGQTLAMAIPNQMMSLADLAQKTQEVADEMDRARILVEKYLLGASVENPIGSVYDSDPIGDTINAIVDNSVPALKHALANANAAKAVGAAAPAGDNATPNAVASGVPFSAVSCLPLLTRCQSKSVYLDFI